jgi:hypothetical protein
MATVLVALTFAASGMAVAGEIAGNGKNTPVHSGRARSV